MQVSSEVTSTRVYDWQADVKLDFGDGQAPLTETACGQAAVVVNDNPDAPDALGAGWGIDGLSRLYVQCDGDALWVTGAGDYRLFTFNASDGSYTSPAEDFGTLTRDPDSGVFTYTAPNQTVTYFSSDGLETSVVNSDGQAISYQYDGQDRLTQVTAPDGGVTTFSYGCGATTINEPGGRVVTLTLDGAGDLTQITDVDGTTRSLSYDGDHHVVEDQWAPYDTQFSYASNGSLTTINQGAGIVTTVAAATTDGLPNESAWSGPVTATVSNALGTTAYTLDARGRATEIDQPLGIDESYELNAAGDPVEYTDPLGYETYYVYGSGAAGGDLLLVDSPDGLQTYRYDPTFHEMTYSQDPTSSVTVDTYDPNTGDLLSTTTAYGTAAASTTVFTWSDGLLQTEEDGDGNQTVFTYDADRRVSTVKTYDNMDNLTSSEAFTYDANGNPATETEGVGGPAPRTTDTTFNAAGEETSETDPDGNETETTYDAAGLEASSTDGRNVETTDQYNTAGLVTVETDDANTATPEVTRDYYDNAGDLTETIDPLGDKTEETYDAVGRVTDTTDLDAQNHVIDSESETYDADSDVKTTTDGDHNTTVDTFDAEGDVLTAQEKNALGIVVSTESALYDGDGDVTSSTDADHNVTTDSYDAAGDQTAEVDDGGVGGSDANVYDKDGNLVWSKDADGNVTVNIYDDNELVESKTTAANGQVTSDVKDTYNLFGELATSTDGDGNVTTDTYDGDGDVLSEQTTNANHQVVSSESYTYDADGDVATTTDADHNVTTEVYNADDEVVGQITTDANHHVVSSDAATYDADGNVLTSTDADSNVTTNTYDDGQVTETKVVSATGRTVSDLKYTYDEDGNVLTTTDGDNNVTTNTYDANGNMLTTQMKDAAGNVISSQVNTYDPNGNLLTSTDGDGNVTTNVYDAASRVLYTQLTDHAGNVITSTTNTYDDDGNLLTSTDNAGDVTFNQYEGGNLVSTTVGYGTSAAATTTYTYDDDGNQLSETDPDGNTTYYTYDAYGNVLTTTTPLGTTTNTYDDDGNLLTTIDPDGRKIVNSYDGNLLTGTVWYNADGTVNNVFSYTYDGDGNMLTATDNAGTVTMTYNGNQLITRTDPFGMTLTYGYDAAGNIISEADSLGGLTTMTYDGNQMVSQTYQDATTHLVSYFSYDGDGNTVEIARYAYVSGAQQLVATTYSAYDGGQITSIVTTDAAGNVLQSDAYSYDAAGRLASETDNGITTTFGYDATGQLTSDGGTGYSYDANGNRTTPGYVTGTDNELLSDGTWNYTYDADGNTISKVNIATGETWTYAYDLNNRLISATDRNADGSLIQATYLYDALGNRIQESVTTPTGTTVNNYAFDAAGNVWADLDGNNGNGLETRRLFLQGADQVFARIGESGGTAGAAWYLTDYQGTVQDLIDNGGNVLDHETYDAFGNVTSETNPAQGDRFGFQGGQDDPVTGYWLFNHRFLNSIAGDWFSQDPSGLKPDSNRYRFVGNGPTDGTDPSGLEQYLAPTGPLTGGVDYTLPWHVQASEGQGVLQLIGGGFTAFFGGSSTLTGNPVGPAGMWVGLDNVQAGGYRMATGKVRPTVTSIILTQPGPFHDITGMPLLSPGDASATEFGFGFMGAMPGGRPMPRLIVRPEECLQPSAIAPKTGRFPLEVIPSESPTVQPHGTANYVLQNPTTQITPEMEIKITLGEIRGNKIVGGHSREVFDIPSRNATISGERADGVANGTLQGIRRDGTTTAIKPGPNGTHSFFPESWTNNEIIAVTKQIADMQPVGISGTSTIHQGIYKGVVVEVIKDSNGFITASWPK